MVRKTKRKYTVTESGKVKPECSTCYFGRDGECGLYSVMCINTSSRPSYMHESDIILVKK